MQHSDSIETPFVDRNSSGRFFKSLLESAPDAMIVVDRDGRIVIVNRRAERMFGYCREEMYGQEVEFLLPDRSRSKHIKLRQHYVDNSKSRPMGLGLDLRGRRQDGSDFPVEIALSPIVADEGEFVSSVIRDVTDRSIMESALIEAQQEAERANHANSAFLAAASHDLRQPVQALSLLNGALRRTVTDPRALKMLDGQSQSLTAMTNLLNSLLDISRLDAGAVAPKFEDFPIDGLIEQLSQDFTRQASQKGLLFKSSSSLMNVRSDPDMLAAILTNFVSNSLRYTEHGSVTLTCDRQADSCCLKVCDTGIGISDEQLDQIFGEFYQCKMPGASNEGFGLGLAIVKRLADLLGHDVIVESTVGKGSCFSIVVPVAETNGTIAPSESPKIDSESPRAATGLVMLIEDDAQVASALRLLLETEGYDVVTATSRNEAIARLPGLVVDPKLIVSDYHLAESSTGVETIAAVRDHFKSPIPALIITGDTSQVVDDAGDIARCKVLSKPIDPDQLLAVVAKVMKAVK